MGIGLPLLQSGDGRERALWRTPVGLALFGAFLLPVAVLAAVSVISVVQRMEIRALLTAERYRSLADLAATKLSEGMETWEREMLAEVEGADWDTTALIARIQRAERSFPELRPIVLVDPSGTIVYPLRARATDAPAEGAAVEEPGTAFTRLLADAAEREEAADLAGADRMFARAASAARSYRTKVLALEGLARVRMKRGDGASAAVLYEEITALADPFDPTLARFAVMARVERGDALEAAGRAEEACDARLEALAFLQRHRFNLAPDLYARYRTEAERKLREHEPSGAEKQERLAMAVDAEPELDDIAASLDLLLRQLPQLAAVNASDWLGAQPEVGATDAPANGSSTTSADPPAKIAAGWRIRYLNLQEDTRGATVVSIRDGDGWQVARRWRPHSVKKVMYWVMGLEGPWKQEGVALIDPGGNAVFRSTSKLPVETVPSRIALPALPGWSVVAYPAEGSLDQHARQDVVAFAVLLSAAFLAVVGALVLATRTVSRQVALARARSDFVSNVSHELKTPLALIRMFAENLKAGWVPAPKKDEYYGVMLGEAERLSGVIDNVLDFSRIESGRREYELRLTDLNELVSELVDRYRYSFDTADIDLEVEIPEIPVTARVDRDAIAQVLVNLLSNAAKYIGDPPRRVRLVLRAEGDCAWIEVHDSGVGMSSDDVERIFTPFCRLNHAGLRSVAGSGIGLTIVRHIVEAHGGHVAVESTPGVGSVFSVLLPFEPQIQSESPHPEPRS